MSVRYPRRHGLIPTPAHLVQVDLYAQTLKGDLMLNKSSDDPRIGSTIHEALEQIINCSPSQKEAYDQVANIAVAALAGLRQLNNEALPGLYYLGTDSRLYVMDGNRATIEGPREQYLAQGLLDFALDMLLDASENARDDEDVDDEESIGDHFQNAWAVIGEVLTPGQIECRERGFHEFHWLARSGKMFHARVDDNHVKIVEPVRAFVDGSPSPVRGWVEGKYFCWTNEQNEKMGTENWEPTENYPIGKGTEAFPRLYWPPAADNPNTHKAHLKEPNEWVYGRHHGDFFSWEDSRGDSMVTPTNGVTKVVKL